MRFQEDFTRAVDYIEDNLDGKIDYETAARLACCSAYHFQRMFSYIVGVPLAEYIRRRRMTRAAFDLRESGVKVVELAAAYGYDSQSSFTRAFQAFHGATPSQARHGGRTVKAYPRVSLELSVKGAEEMCYRLERTEPYSLFGFAIPLTPAETGMEHIFDKLGLYADEVLENGTHDETNLAAGQPAHTLLDAVRFGFQADGSCTFMFAARAPGTELPDSFTVVPVPSAEWAVFDYQQVHYPETNEPLYRRIYEEWFPTSGYEQAEGPCIERFPDGRMEAWIPVQRKA